MKESHVSHSWSKPVLLRSLFCFISLPSNSPTLPHTHIPNWQIRTRLSKPATYDNHSFPRPLGKDLCCSKKHYSLICPVPGIYYPRQVKTVKACFVKGMLYFKSQPCLRNVRPCFTENKCHSQNRHNWTALSTSLFSILTPWKNMQTKNTFSLARLRMQLVDRRLTSSKQAQHRTQSYTESTNHMGLLWKWTGSKLDKLNWPQETWCQLKCLQHTHAIKLNKQYPATVP